MIQSLVHKDEVDDLVAGYGQVIVDECTTCRQSPSSGCSRSASSLRHGLTATVSPRRAPADHPHGAARSGSRSGNDQARAGLSSIGWSCGHGFRRSGPRSQAAIRRSTTRRRDAPRNELSSAMCSRPWNKADPPVLRSAGTTSAFWHSGSVTRWTDRSGGMRSRKRETPERLRDPESRAGSSWPPAAYRRRLTTPARHALPGTAVSWKGTLVSTRAVCTACTRKTEGGSTTRGREVPVLARMFQRRLKGIGRRVCGRETLPFRQRYRAGRP